MKKNRSYYIERITSILAAIILLQTLFFKFTAAPESVYIFSALGMEPFGRIGIGIVELIAAILLIIRKTSFLGALLSIGLMFGAVYTHLFIIGIEVQNDGGSLFVLAILVLVCSFITLALQRNRLVLFIHTKSQQ